MLGKVYFEQSWGSDVDVFVLEALNTLQIRYNQGGFLWS